MAGRPGWGEVPFLPIPGRQQAPPPTAHRGEQGLHFAEEGRVAIRNLRRAARHELEAFDKDGELSHDELARAEKRLDEITHAEEAAINSALEQKEQELLED